MSKLILVILFSFWSYLPSCGQRTSTITCNVQYVHHSTSEKDELGPMNLKEAIKFYQEFPFDEQVAQFENYKDVTVPTISLVNNSKEAVFATWALDSVEHELFFELSGDKKFIRIKRDSSKAINCIKLFYSNEYAQLKTYMESIDEYEELIKNYK